MAPLFYYEKHEVQLLDNKFYMTETTTTYFTKSFPSYEHGYTTYTFDSTTGTFKVGGQYVSLGQSSGFYSGYTISSDNKILYCINNYKGYNGQLYYKKITYIAQQSEGAGKLIETIIAEDNSYPENGKFIDGYWYIKISPAKYAPQGTWESPIIDLGESWKETKLIDVVKQINTGATDITLEISSSTDGVSFTPYTLLDSSNPPQARYIKILATLSAQEQQGEVKNLDFNQSNSENIMTLNEFTEANGNLQLKNHYTQDMTDDGVLGAGKQFSITLNKANFKSIKSININ